MQTKLLQPAVCTNPIVFFDINIGKEYVGRMIIELRKDVVPRSAENFRLLCTGDCGKGKMGKPLHYKSTRFHGVKRMHIVQGGDVVNNDGSCGESIYGPCFEDENFSLPHSEGFVGLANYGEPHTNNSQFYIGAMSCDALNGLSMVVGYVLRGIKIISEMEEYTTKEGTPTADIIIADCGELDVYGDWGCNCSDDTGDVLPPFPQDWADSELDHSLGNSLSWLNIIRKAGNVYFERNLYHDARQRYRKANRYCDFFHTELQSKGIAVSALAKFSVLNNLNLAAVELKLGNYQSASSLCSKVILSAPHSSKGYFRRGQANVGLKQFEEAIRDFKVASRLHPEDRDIAAALRNAQIELTKYKEQQRTVFKKLFS